MISDINPLFRVLFSRFGEPQYGDAANAFSFNDPLGMCLKCQGIGRSYVLNLDAAFDYEKSISEGGILLPGYGANAYYTKMIISSGLFDNDKPIKEFSKTEMKTLLRGDVVIPEGKDNKLSREFHFEGVENLFLRLNVNSGKETTAASQKNLDKFAVMTECDICEGKRFNKQVLDSKINGLNIFDLTDMQLDELKIVLKEFKDESMKPIIDDIQKRISDLIEIGLDYLSLTRETTSLSGGESQRVKTVKYLSNSLTDLTYILDEPSTGLHPRDVYRLNELLIKLRDKGNTVIVVEHDPDVIKIADYIIDVGPKAGIHGGEIMYAGDYAGLLTSGTLTGNYLQTKLPMNENPRAVSDFIESKISSLHNLKNVSLKIPEGLFTVVTGVAGSGKSTLVDQVFAEEHPEAIKISQNALHANSRSNSATYTGIMNQIRKLFAKANDVKDSLFSYNSKGACPECGGKGVIELNLSFMDNAEIECPTCHGSRYANEVLEYQLNGKNIVEVMKLSVEEARVFFDDKKINTSLDNLLNVGLGYLALGQSLDTLSGGESQRLKIANELNNKGNIYILDEPTTGLHTSDVENIIRIINDLVDKKNTVIVIEHNTDVMRSADWIIDIGPDGGSHGGQIVYEGRASEISSATKSITKDYI